MKRVLVIGGGAAGMMAAIEAARGGCAVTLLEKNEKLGKKIYITGKGRCNVTNACDTVEFFGNIVSNEKFLYSAVYGYEAWQLMAFLEEQGCRLKTERGNRVFPVSDHASDVTRAFSKALDEAGVRIRLHAGVKEILKNGAGAVEGVLLQSGEQLQAEAVIVATGGLSYQTTGSTGDGYRFARSCGHTVTSLRPALVPFEIQEEWCGQLQGLALKNVSATLLVGQKECYNGFGEMLFTHFGVSGPLILSASSYYAKSLRQEEKRAARKLKGPQPAAGKRQDLANGTGCGIEAELILDLKPALTEEQLDKRLLREFEAAKNKQFKNAIDGLFPARLIPVMLQVSGIDPEKKVHDITKEERQGFVRRIKHWSLTVTGTRDFSEAIVTQGGVDVKEVNPSTMESRLVKGLYFAGEVLDVDALTGGFNLQLAFSTGRLAGESAAAGE